jgi:hypothetical protein
MKALIRLETTTELIGPLIEILKCLGYEIVEEEEIPDLVVTDDPSFFLGRTPEVLKIFVYDPSSTPPEIAKGVLCLTPAQVLERFTKGNPEV